MANKTTLSRLIILFVAGLLAACGTSNVVIEGNFPTPNINKMPLSLAVYYDDALREFAFMEYSETGREEINIESGLSHIQLFNTILPAMFDQVVNISNLEDAASQNVDAVFAPAIEEFQLALPKKTKLDMYEVWIKYNMRLLTSDGEYIADWVVTSYGKTPTQNFLSIEDGINEAAIVALRDLAANLTLNFTKFPDVEDWLSSL